MSKRELIENYLKGETDAISVIRILSGIFDPKYADGILVLICAITRIEQGDLDKETFRSIWLKEPEKNEG